MQRGEALLPGGRAALADGPGAVGEPHEETAITDVSTRPNASSPSLAGCWTIESANVGSRKFAEPVGDPERQVDDAGDHREHGEDGHRDAHLPVCSAMWWPSPGKPTSVSSISPFAGFVGCGAW